MKHVMFDHFLQLSNAFEPHPQTTSNCIPVARTVDNTKASTSIVYEIMQHEGKPCYDVFYNGAQHTITGEDTNELREFLRYGYHVASVVVADGAIYRFYRDSDFPCKEHPELLLHKPIGQYHCPFCYEMVMAGMLHPDYSKELDEQPE